MVKLSMVLFSLANMYKGVTQRNHFLFSYCLHGSLSVISLNALFQLTITSIQETVYFVIGWLVIYI